VEIWGRPLCKDFYQRGTQIIETPTQGKGNGNDMGSRMSNFENVMIDNQPVKLPYARHCGKYPSCFQCGEPDGECRFNQRSQKDGVLALNIRL